MGINLSLNMSAVLSATSGNIAQFDALVEDAAGKFVIATTANLAGGRLPRCVALSASSQGQVVAVQQFGPVPGVVAAIGGAAGEAYAVVDAAGHIQRSAIPLVTDVVVGWIGQDGTLYCNFVGRADYYQGAYLDTAPLLVANSMQGALDSMKRNTFIHLRAVPLDGPAGTNPYVNATLVQTITLPDNAKAAYVQQVAQQGGIGWARAGAGTKGQLGVTARSDNPLIAGTLMVAATGDIMFLATDAWTLVDIIYVPERQDIVSGTYVVTPGTGAVVGLPAGLISILEAESLAGGTIGKCIVRQPGDTAPSTLRAQLTLSKDGVLFCIADGVTSCRLKLGVAIAGLALSCATPAPNFVRGQRPSVAAAVVPTWVDARFSGTHHAQIIEAVDAWNDVLNGHLRFQVVSESFDMEPGVLARIDAEGGVLVLRRGSTDPVVAMLPDGVLGWTPVAGAHVVSIVEDTIGDRSVRGVTLHELGHVLGLGDEHVVLRGVLMHPTYTVARTACVDRATAASVAGLHGWDLGRLNYCERN